KKFFCEYCSKGFTRNDSLNRHQKITCIYRQLDPETMYPEEQETLRATVKKLEHQIIQLKEKQTTTDHKQENIEKHIDELEKHPRLTQNILQVVCIQQNDNYLDMLTKEWGNFDKALEYIKDCA